MKTRWPSAADHLIYHAVGHDYRVSGGSFFQTNRFLIDELVRVATGGATGKAALDLYAGVGLFTLPLAANFDEVLAVEASPHAFADLRHNAPRNVKPIRATTEAFLAEARQRSSRSISSSSILLAPGWARRQPRPCAARPPRV